MKSILVTSTRAYSGKTGVSLALIRDLDARGLNVGYFKPFGTMPVRHEDLITDQDAFYVNGSLRHPSPVDAICPVVKTRDLLESCMAGAERDMRERVASAYARVAEGRDVVLIEGPSDVFQGLTISLSVCQVADLLEARVLLIDRPERIDFPDEVLGAADCLHQHLAGVLFNWVDESQTEYIHDHVAEFVRARGIPVFGALPVDPGLASITVGEIVESLAGTVLTAEGQLERIVESFMIGAMGQDKALRFFRRKARKAVITGGDRADVQLAALETNTSCLILTGNLPPSSIVLSRAEELGVPMVLVDMDTLTAVERMENLLGRMRVHDPAKADRIRELLTTHADLPALLAAFGIA